MRIILSLLASLFLVNNLYSQTELTGWGKIYQKGEAISEKSFSEFYAALKSAVESKNADYVYGIVSPDIEINHYEQDQNNIKFFKSKYDLRDSTNDFWVSAKKILSMGAFVQNYGYDVIYYPSVSFTEDYNNILGEEYYLKLQSNQNYANAVYDNVLVYKEANENSEVLGKLNYEVVMINNFEYEKNIPWYQILLKDGSPGYVKYEDLYLSIFDYLMAFRKVDGFWKMVMFQRSGV
ncbi:MAG: SH3 domain-containing protein [bacterium]